MDKKIKKAKLKLKISIIVTLITIGIVCYLYFIDTMRLIAIEQEKLLEKGIVTLGVFKQRYNGRTKKQISYDYLVGKKRYSSADIFCYMDSKNSKQIQNDKIQIKKGDAFIVIVDSTNYRNSKILLDYPIHKMKEYEEFKEIFKQTRSLD